MKIESIMRMCLFSNTGTVIRNCLQSSVNEAIEAQKKYPKINLKIVETEGFGTCIIISPNKISKRLLNELTKSMVVVPIGHAGVVAL